MNFYDDRFFASLPPTVVDARSLHPDRSGRGGGATTWLLAACVSVLLSSGCDNPACVFGPNGCQVSNDGGALCGQAASDASDHQWLAKAAPTFEEFFPGGTNVHPDTPIVLTFSESMSRQSMTGAFELLVQGGGPSVPLPPGALIGDGRMLVLFPPTSLAANQTYELRLADAAIVTDLQGCELAAPSGDLFGSFSVGATPPTTPSLVTTWPPKGASDQSTTGEIIAVFDRKVTASSVSKDSFVVEVNGAIPTFNPAPQALLVVSNGIPFSDTRVFRYRSVDDEGLAVVLGIGVQVDVTLSPSAHKISMQDGSQLAATSFDFDLASITAPSAAEIVSQPTDAIGIDNLTGGSSTAPALEVALTLDDAQPNDRIGVFILGHSTVAPGALLSVYREFDVSDVPYDALNEVLTVGEAQLNIAKTGSPLETYFADGSISIAFRRQRGNVASPVRLLDADVKQDGNQSPLLDTNAPSLTAWSPTGTSKTKFRSDLRNFSLIGRADETLSRVIVSTTLGDNGVLPKVVASNSQGLFIASPFSQPEFLVPLDESVGDNPLPFTATLYDRALNASTPVSAQFTQVGAVFGQALPQIAIRVEVFDSASLVEVVSARVFVHQDLGGTITAVTTSPGLTGSTGVALVPCAPAGETIVTVDASGYDLFTLHGLAVDHLSVPLMRSSQSASTTSGDLTSTDGAVANLERALFDSRAFAQSTAQIDVGSCSVDPISQQLECAYGPYVVQPGRLGALSAFVFDTPPNEFSYSAAGFLKAFNWKAPQSPVSAGVTQTTTVSSGTLLDDPTVDDEEHPFDGPALTFSVVSTIGLDTANLVGAPQAFLESKVPGLAAPSVVGLGLAFVQGALSWNIRSAIPGIADPDPPDTKYSGDLTGELVTDGSIDPDLMLRCEVRDTFGARALRRPRLSAMPGTLDPLDAAALSSPTPGSGHTGAVGFDIQITQVIPDGLGQPGLYRILLVGANGRVWRLHRFDPSGTALVTVHAPDIVTFGGTSLPNGTIQCSIEAFCWPGFDSTSFFWSDIEREFDGCSLSSPKSFTKP